MKHLLISLFLSLTITTQGIFAAEEPENILLRSILDAGATQVFSLSEADGQSSKWVKIGQTYKGYTITAYDASEKKLTLEKDEQVFEIRLATAKVQESADDEDPETRLAEAEKIMTMINFEGMIGATLEAQIANMKKIVRQQLTARNPQIDEASIQSKLTYIDEMFSNIDWKPVQEGVISVYAETFTQTELEAISSFYASPAGQSTLEKAPAVQRRMSELMMPVLMQTSQDIAKGLHSAENEAPEN